MYAVCTKSLYSNGMLLFTAGSKNVEVKKNGVQQLSVKSFLTGRFIVLDINKFNKHFNIG